ncbi:MAG: SLBB domain-containing protein [Desulfuromonadaceae bacterium]|nr:SLBB domain-containing protein [Desulfuromonadaceae bacterium]
MKHALNHFLYFENHHKNFIKQILYTTVAIFLLISADGAIAEIQQNTSQPGSIGQVMPTQIVPTQIAPTQVAPTQVAPTQVVPTQVVPIQVVPTQALPTAPPPTPPSAESQAEAPSRIETALADYMTGAETPQSQEFTLKKQKQFGYSFFRPESQGFAALTDIPVGPDYVIGNGDRLLLTSWGSVEGTFPLEVNRNGDIVLPKVGTVKVAGVTYGQLPTVISAQLHKVFKDFHISITMDKLRLLKVYVVGEVKAPGDYSISALSTLINALSAAGGPTKSGTLRNIAIKRNGTLVETVDLYDFFLKGDKNRDIRLQAGDTIFVPSIGPVAGVAGNVRRPGIYELKGEKNLKELLDLADGIIPTGYLQRVQIARVKAHTENTVFDVSLEAAKPEDVQKLAAGIPLKDMDVVKVFPIDGALRGFVRLEGHVLRPGDYAIKPGMRLSSLITPDNLLPEYSTKFGQIIRRSPPEYQPRLLYFNLAKAQAGDVNSDLALQEQDKIRVFSRWDQEEVPKVKIGGDVQKPGEYRYYNDMTVRDLLILGGNLKRTAYLSDAEITRIKVTETSVASFPISIRLDEVLKGNPEHNIKLEPSDELMVRRIPNWYEESDRYVTLKGEFVFPGVYPIYKGERLSSIFKRAGGLTDKAYLAGARFMRASVKEQQQKRMDEFAITAEQEVNTQMANIASVATSQEELAGAKASLEGVKSNLKLLKALKAEGRMVIQLSDLQHFAGSPYDIEVMAGDVVEIPQSSNAVSVLGRVVNPTSFVHLDGKTVGDYLGLAGGTTNDSEASEIYVIRVDGSIYSRQQYSSIASLVGGGFLNERIAAGDSIIVPQKYEKTPWLRTVKDITTIMSQLAITAGTILLGLR